MRSRLGPIRDHPQSQAFPHELMREAEAVARARGVPLAPDYLETRIGMIDPLPARMTTSIQCDLSRGNRLELPWLNGKVVELGWATPLNRAVCDVLALHVNGSVAV
jgi:2-dehydropantoate 2-reductase